MRGARRNFGYVAISRNIHEGPRPIKRTRSTESVRDLCVWQAVCLAPGSRSSCSATNGTDFSHRGRRGIKYNARGIKYKVESITDVSNRGRRGAIGTRRGYPPCPPAVPKALAAPADRPRNPGNVPGHTLATPWPHRSPCLLPCERYRHMPCLASSVDLTCSAASSARSVSSAAISAS